MRRAWRSGVSAERRHLKKSGKVCGGLPTRRYGAAPRKQQEGELGLKERWYPIQVKQKDKAGRKGIGPNSVGGAGASSAPLENPRAGLPFIQRRNGKSFRLFSFCGELSA